MPRGRVEWTKGCECPNPNGRPKGAKTTVTQSLKKQFMNAFEELGGWNGMVTWAKKSDHNYLEFIKLVSKMLPRELVGGDGEAITVIIQRAPVVRPENAGDISAKQVHPQAIPE